MHLDEAFRIIGDSYLAGPDTDRKSDWESFWGRVSEQVRARCRTWAEGGLNPAPQIGMLRQLATIAPKLLSEDKQDQAEVHTIIRNIEEIAKREAYVTVKLDQPLEQDLGQPAGRTLFLTWPFSSYEGSSREASFYLPCCASSADLSKLPEEYGSLLAWIKEERARTVLDTIPPQWYELLKEVFQRFDAQGKMMGRPDGLAAETRRLFRAHAAIVQHLEERFKFWPSLDQAVATVESDPTVWILPLMDEHDFYHIAWRTYTMEDELAPKHPFFIFSTSPGTLRPDEYFGPYWGKLGPDEWRPGSFTIDAIVQDWNRFTDFGRACAQLCQEFASAPKRRRQSINRPLYFDMGIGRDCPNLQRIYIASAAMEKPHVLPNGATYSFSVDRSEDGDALVLTTDDEVFANAARELFRGFVESGRIELRTNSHLFSGSGAPHWPRFLTLVGKATWVISTRGGSDIRNKISHGFLLKWGALIEAMKNDPLARRKYGEIPWLVKNILSCWHMEVRLDCDDSEPHVQLQSILNQVTKNLSEAADHSPPLRHLIVNT